MPKPYTQETFLKRIEEVHGDKIDVSNFIYKNSISTGEAKCNICGNVWYPRADVLIRGCGCRKCFDKKNSEYKTIPFDEIQSKISATTLNKDTYIDTKHHCEAKCNTCGYVWYPNVRDLLNGSGCPECGKKRVLESLQIVYARRKKPKTEKISQEELKFKKFLENSKKIHGDKYDYSKVEYKNRDTKVCIICPIHGEFWQTPHQHLKTQGCPKCGIELNTKHRTMPFEKVEQQFKEIGLKFKYDPSTYVSMNKPMKFICEKHDEFWKTPIRILRRETCPLCCKTKKLTKEEFIKKGNIIHNQKYIYDEAEYINNRTKVCIICPTHGKFWQTPNDHLDGCGCPKCYSSKLEEKISNKLNEESIEFIERKTHKWLLNEDTNYHLTLDFYLPKYKIAIECQGEQHFKPIEYFGGVENFKKVQRYDVIKKQKCKDNGIELIYYLDEKYNKFMNDDDIYFNDVEELIEHIKLIGE